MPEIIITESCKAYLDEVRSTDREDAPDLSYTQLIARLKHRAGRASGSEAYHGPTVYDGNDKIAHKNGPSKNP
jgi:hypothetical protein